MTTKNIIINEKQFGQMTVGEMQGVIKDLLKIGQGLAGHNIMSVSVAFTNTVTASKLYILDLQKIEKKDSFR